jgi:hypothetical protein
MEISILGSKKISNIVECFLNSQPPCGVIRTTPAHFLLPHSFNSMHFYCRRTYTDSDWPLLMLNVIARGSATGTLAICYVYSAEIYPTVIRNIGLGTSSFWVRVTRRVCCVVD